MIHQLNPMIPVFVPSQNKEGYAVGWIVYSQEHHVLWGVAFDDDGSVYWADNTDIRLCWNRSMGRRRQELSDWDKTYCSIMRSKDGPA